MAWKLNLELLDTLTYWHVRSGPLPFTGRDPRVKEGPEYMILGPRRTESPPRARTQESPHTPEWALGPLSASQLSAMNPPMGVRSAVTHQGMHDGMSAAKHDALSSVDSFSQSHIAAFYPQGDAESCRRPAGTHSADMPPSEPHAEAPYATHSAGMQPSGAMYWDHPPVEHQQWHHLSMPTAESIDNLHAAGRMHASHLGSELGKGDTHMHTMGHVAAGMTSAAERQQALHQHQGSVSTGYSIDGQLPSQQHQHWHQQSAPTGNPFASHAAEVIGSPWQDYGQPSLQQQQQQQQQQDGRNDYPPGPDTMVNVAHAGSAPQFPFSRSQQGRFQQQQQQQQELAANGHPGATENASVSAKRHHYGQQYQQQQLQQQQQHVDGSLPHAAQPPKMLSHPQRQLKPLGRLSQDLDGFWRSPDPDTVASPPEQALSCRHPVSPCGHCQ